MRRTLISLLSCPACGGDLDLLDLANDGPTEATASHENQDDVLVGLLKCQGGHCYPMLDGVPRLLEGGLSSFPEFRIKYADRISSEPLEPVAVQNKRQDDFDYIRDSFSREWKLFDYAGDKTWGWTLQERKQIFLSDMGLTVDQVRGKFLLDAGCGNGTLTAALSDLGLRVVGIDLNDGLGNINRRRDRHAQSQWQNVQYLQANLFEPPIKPESFDLIYCSGVLHHTPSTEQSFVRLVPLVKKGGRLYVWVYGKRSLPVRVFMESGRQLKRAMSLSSLLKVCRLIAPFYKAGTETLNRTGVMKFRSRSVREITLDLFDCFAPRYNHCHGENEVQSWFRAAGLTNVTISGRQKHGFGVYGDRVN
jgi:2-polyprenyl-3-methyl-5-hydroxy-6-metoxy-1,4-benzoquinol methylase/uncharacterized protein YbaR (Trm112 family)